MSDNFDPKRFAWARSKFDIEGLAAAIAAWLVGILLGILWSPLFWIGAIAAATILLATRRSNRSGPVGGAMVVAPVDGVVVSVEPAEPPTELRFPTPDAVRIRISSSPASQNRLFAPASGTIQTVIQESGTESQPIAMDADAHGLYNGFITMDAAGGPVGVRLVTGGLGPRVDIDVRDGDTVEAGDVIGKRRLGGWCDVYLPSGAVVSLVPGATLVGAETPLVAGHGTSSDTAAPRSESEAHAEASPAAAAAVPVEPVDPVAELDQAGTETTGPGETPSQLETLTAEDGQDPSELFAKLRSRVEEAGTTPEKDS